MISKKVLRYYSDCGRGFWKKPQALKHDQNCKCWKNPKFKTCLTCKLKDFQVDDIGMEKEYEVLWTYNNCDHSKYVASAHKNCKHIKIYCPFHEQKKAK